MKKKYDIKVIMYNFERDAIKKQNLMRFTLLILKKMLVRSPANS